MSDSVIIVKTTKAQLLSFGSASGKVRGQQKALTATSKGLKVWNVPHCASSRSWEIVTLLLWIRPKSVDSPAKKKHQQCFCISWQLFTCLFSCQGLHKWCRNKPWNRPLQSPQHKLGQMKFLENALAQVGCTWALLLGLSPHCEQDINGAAAMINSHCLCQLCWCESVPALWLWWAQMDGSCSVWTQRIIAHS